MGKIRITENLTSYEVTIDLIKSVEEYFQSDIPRLLNISPETIKSEYLITVKDNFGAEEFHKMDDYKQKLFYDDTSEIQISLKHDAPRYFKLVLVFNEEKTKCNINIECEADNAREITNSIKEGIKRQLELNKTTNRFLYLPGGIVGILILIGFMLPFATLFFYQDGYPRRAIVSGATFIVLILCATLGKYVYPYTSFDSKKSIERKKWAAWFKFGIAGFILFGVFFTFIYHKLID